MTTTGYTYRPPNPFARRASTIMLILAGLALFVGISVLAICVNYPSLMQGQEFADRMNEINRQFQVDPRLLAGVAGTLFLTYAVIGLTLGFLVRSANVVVIILTLVLAGCFMLLLLLNLVVSFAHGDVGGALVAALLIAGHGAIAKLLIEAIRFSNQTAVTYAPLPTYQPMQAYYMPPVQPEQRYGVV